MKDITIIGGGPAGILFALRARKKYPQARIRIVEGRPYIGHKITISGGGKCNISNEDITVKNYSAPNFVKFALKAWTTQDAKNLIESMSLPYGVRSHGRIFLEVSAQKFVDMLLKKLRAASISILSNTTVTSFSKNGDNFICTTSDGGIYRSSTLVVATGSSAWRKTHSLFGIMQSLENIGHTVYPFSSALAPLYMDNAPVLATLSGISLYVKISFSGYVFYDDLLFTHKGISGPAVLQISSYWNGLDAIRINFLPDIAKEVFFAHAGKKYLKGFILQYLPERLICTLIPRNLMEKKVAELSKQERTIVQNILFHYECIPSSIAPLIRAEVARGGVNLDEITPKTMQSKICPSLFIIGEALDVVGHLGGYNIHFAFASAVLSAQSL